MKKITLLFIVSIISIFTAAAEGFPFKVSSPNGAPSLALACHAAENQEAYTYVAADTIAAEFAGAKADFIIAPVNAGAKLFKAGKSSYRLAAVVTWGNLYFATQKKDFSLEDLKKSSVTLFGENTINASVALEALKKSGIVPSEVKYLASAAATQSLLLSDKNAVVLTAEPALTAAKMKNTQISSWSVNELLGKTAGISGYAQAGLFVKAQTIRGTTKGVKDFLKKAQDSCAKCAELSPEAVKAAVQLKILPNAKVAEKALPGCAVRYMNARDARPFVEATASIDIRQFGGSIPADDFYY